MKRILLITLFVWISSLAFSQLSITVNQQNVTCFGLANGSASVNVSGGTPAYTFTWLPGGQTSSSISNLTAGQYTIIAEDATSATSSYIFFISEPSQLSVSTQVFNGAVTQQTVGALCNGNYSVQITDANGCVDTSLFNVNYNLIPLTVTETHTNVSCDGICSGAVSFSVTGGSGSYYYNLSGYTTVWSSTPITSLNQYSLCAGGYSLSVTDSISGCAAYSTFFITSLSNDTIPNLTVSSISHNESCLAIGNGSIDVTVSGSNPGPFTYLWSNGTSMQDAINLTSNSYWVTIIDGNGNCETIRDTIFSIDSIPNITTTLTSINETCYLSSDGAIDLTINGTNPGPFTYLWSNGATSQDIFNASSNIYSVRILDANANCLVLSDTISFDGINCGSISGHVYIDNNGNCLYDWQDNSVFYASLNIQPGNRYGYVNPDGSYVVNDLPFGTYTVTAIPYFMYYTTTCTTTISTTINATTPAVSNNNLFVGFNSSTNPDMIISAYSNGIVPGMPSHVYYYLENINNVSASGIFKVTLPSAFIPNILNCSPSTYTVSGDTVMWDFNNIGFNFYSIYSAPNFSIEFIPPLSTPLGSIFSSCIFAQPSIADFDPSNNVGCYQRYVTGSFDPNDKTVSPVGEGPNGIIDSTTTELTYTIRFQNTGNGSAVNIIVKDTLSANLDINTFEILHASHNYNIEILSGNVLRWKFNNIMLADSGSNEPASHGYVQYRIKRNNNNAPGTQIKNTAYIYFDFNEPVVTNTAINTIGTINGIKSIDKNIELINQYPNPANGLLTITSNYNYSKIELLNVTGQVLLSETVNDKTHVLQLQNLAEGIYFVKVSCANGMSVTKKVVKQ